MNGMNINNKNKNNINDSNNKNKNNNNNINNVTCLMLVYPGQALLAAGPQLSSLPYRPPHRIQTEREPDLSSYSSADVQNTWSFTSILQICFHGVFIIKHFNLSCVFPCIVGY
jgi:hypothetical protein